MDDPRAAVHSLARRDIGPVHPIKAHGVPLHRRMHPDQAFRATLSDCLAQITANAATLRTGCPAEGLHQLRVGLRRLDVACKIFGEEFGQDWLIGLRGRAKILSSRLGPARDLDVFTEAMDAFSRAPAQEGDDGAFAHLAVRVQEMRSRAWTGAGDCIAGADFSLFLDDIAALAQSRLPLGRNENLVRMAARMLARQDKQVRKRGRQADTRRDRDLHRLRIALKKLRYMAEFFAPLFSRKRVARYLKKVRRLQEQLGHINDSAHARATLAVLLRGDGAAKPDGQVRFAAGVMAGWYRARAPRLAEKALRRWRHLRGSAPFWA